jgi:hypothetical protein
MPELSTVARNVQLGKETTPGTGVTATKQLQYIGFKLDPALEMNTFTPMGSKVPSAVTPGKDASVLTIDGAGSYSEIVYILSNLLKDVTPSTVDTSGKSWLYEPLARTEETKARYTIEEGSSVRAGKATYGVVTDATLTYNRTEGLTVSGSGFAQNYQANITLTPTPTVIEEAIILPTHINIYSNDTFGAIGTTKLTRDFNAELAIGGVVGQVWPLNSANASYAADVELVPSATIKLTCSADTQGEAFLTAARAGATKYVRLEAKSTVLAGAATAFYSLTVDLACKVSEYPGYDDTDGLKTVEVTLVPVLDSTFSAPGAWCRITAVNKTASL